MAAADVVNIGAGILGLSSVYHMTNWGLSCISLLDCGPSSAFPTLRGWNAIRQQFLREIKVRMGCPNECPNIVADTELTLFIAPICGGVQFGMKKAGSGADDQETDRFFGEEAALIPQFGLKFQPATATLVGLSATSTAYLAEDIRTGLIAVDRGRYQAADSLGLCYRRTIGRIVPSQALPALLPPYMIRAIITSKATCVAVILGLLPNGLLAFLRSCSVQRLATR